MFEQTSVTTSAVPQLLFAILPKSCIGAFSTPFVFTVPVVVTIKFRSYSGLVKKLSITIWQFESRTLCKMFTRYVTTDVPSPKTMSAYSGRMVFLRAYGRN